jgi:hypothetical protein
MYAFELGIGESGIWASNSAVWMRVEFGVWKQRKIPSWAPLHANRHSCDLDVDPSESPGNTAAQADRGIASSTCSSRSGARGGKGDR